MGGSLRREDPKLFPISYSAGYTGGCQNYISGLCLGLRVQGFKGLGFRVLGFRSLGFRVIGGVYIGVILGLYIGMILG